MRSVDVGIGHDDDLVVGEFGEVDCLGVFLCAYADAQRAEHGLYLLVVEHAVLHGFLHVENLASQRKYGLELAVASLLGGAACGVALDEEYLAVLGCARGAVGEFAGESAAHERGLAEYFVACVVGCLSGLCGEHDLVDDGAGLLGVLFEVVAERFADGLRHGGHHLLVAELGLGLSLELRFEHFDRHYGRESLAEVVAGHLDLGFFEYLVVVGIFLEGLGESAAEAGEVCAALYCVDVVDVGVDVLAEVGVVGERHLHGYSLALGGEVYDVGYQLCLVGVDVAHEFLKSVLGVEHFAAVLAFGVGDASVGEREGDSGVEEGQVAQTVGQCGVVVDGDGEYRCVGQECDGGAGVGALALYAQLRGGLAAGVFLHVVFAVAVDLGAEVGGEGVDTRYAYAVESARHFVAAFVEFTAGMEHREHYLESAFVLFFVHVDRYASTVVDHCYGVVFVDGHFDVCGKSGQRFVDGVVHHFIHEVMESFLADVADVHRRAFAHGFESFKHLNVARTVVFFFYFCHVGVDFLLVGVSRAWP